MLCTIFLISGCGKYSESDIIKDLKKKIESANSYNIEGTMEIINNEDTYTYQVTVSYKAKDNYLVSLLNKSNNHEQVILRNNDGVYVVTPSLNKSFKFQSDWPYNNSQVYLLGSILEDLESDDNKKFEEVDEYYIFTSQVNYPNNKKLVKQKIKIDKKLNIKDITVLDENDNAQIKITFNKIDLKAKFKDNYFDLDQIIKPSANNNQANTQNNQGTNTTTNDNQTNTQNNQTNNTNTTNQNTNTTTNNNNNTTTNNNQNTNNTGESSNSTNTTTNTNSNTTASINDIVYPMYLPTNTYLTNQQKVETDSGERLILTFGGDKPFMLIEETAAISDEHIIVPTSGDITQLIDTIGVVNDNSLNWVSNGIEYYVISDVASTDELLDVARSISVLPVSK